MCVGWGRESFISIPISTCTVHTLFHVPSHLSRCSHLSLHTILSLSALLSNVLFMRQQDGGGLFKDFMESLIKEAFAGNRGLFAATTANQIYPDPAGMVVYPRQMHPGVWISVNLC